MGRKLQCGFAIYQENNIASFQKLQLTRLGDKMDVTTCIVTSLIEPVYTKSISIIVPVYNERKNIHRLVEKLEVVLVGFVWEVIFVDDDSPDKTSSVVRRIAATKNYVRCIQRIGRRGLSSATIEGVCSSSADYIAIMDGDLQHDESILPTMIKALDSGCDLVVGSRHVVGGGSSDGFSSPFREMLSTVGKRIACAMTRTNLSDPMSGFFLTRRALFMATAHKLSGQGFKILLDFIMSSKNNLSIIEVPYIFRKREFGESKLDIMVMLQFAILILDKLFHGYIPIRFIAFALVGVIGVLVNVMVMVSLKDAGFGFVTSQSVGIFVSIVSNFELNNRFTYRTNKLRGYKYWLGLAAFMLISGLGGVANVGTSSMLYTNKFTDIFSSLAGSIVGVAWNYAISSTLIWRFK